MSIFPTKSVGKWAVGLTAGFLILLLAFFGSMAMGIVDFDTGPWWDITVAIGVGLELVALVLTIVALRKEKSVMTIASLVVACLVIVFLLTHSLFISD